MTESPRPEPGDGDSDAIPGEPYPWAGGPEGASRARPRPHYLGRAFILLLGAVAFVTGIWMLEHEVGPEWEMHGLDGLLIGIGCLIVALSPWPRARYKRLRVPWAMLLPLPALALGLWLVLDGRLLHGGVALLAALVLGLTGARHHGW